MNTHKQAILVISILAIIAVIVTEAKLYQRENVISIVLPEGIESVSIQSNGKSVTITDSEALEEIINLVDDVRMRRLRSSEFRESFAPGSGTLYIYFFSSSEQCSLSLPYWKHNDNYYIIDSRNDIIDQLTRFF